MKVVLISPFPNLLAFGIRTLSACLKRANYNVKLIFLPKYFTKKYSNKTLSNLIKLSMGSGLIGISLSTNYFDNAAQITKELKKLKIPILWGGIHPTIRPEECLKYADMVCIGEGEEAIIELAEKIDQKQNYCNINGIWFKTQKGIVKNPIRPLIQNLDSLPPPDYNYDGHYILDGDDVYPINDKLLKKYIGNNYLTITTRGCPFGCSYCCNSTLNKLYAGQTIIRKRSADNIIEELVAIKNKLPFIKHINIEDDAFLVRDIEEIKQFAKKYKERVGLSFTVGGASPATITEKKLTALVEAGMTVIRLGIQSASENTKKLYKRYHSNQQIEKAVRLINKFKDKIKRPQYDVILDNPWESDDDLIQTLIFLTKLPTPYHLELFSLTLYPKTDLYQKAKAEGIITNDLEDVYRKNFEGVRKSYLNRLFFLLDEYASADKTISTKIMSLLTNWRLRKLKLNWLLYLLLKIRALFLFFKKEQFIYYVKVCIKDIRKGEWSRILKHLKDKL